MNLRLNTAEQAFCSMVRAKLHLAVGSEVMERVRCGLSLEPQEIRASHLALHALGWAVPHWPLEWGGAPLTEVQRLILQEEIERACLPPPVDANVSIVGPILAAFGSQTQKERFLKRMARLDDWWCAGLPKSPNSPAMRPVGFSATRGADGYRVSGRAAQVHFALYADWMLVLVQTDHEHSPEAGTSLVLVDFKSAGVTVLPSSAGAGRSGYADVTMDNVKVPFENLVGAEHHGWRYSAFVLRHDRTHLAGTGAIKELLARARSQLKVRCIPSDTELWLWRLRIAELEAELTALEILQFRVTAPHCLEFAVDAAMSMLRLKGAQLRRDVLHLLLELTGSNKADATEGRSVNWRNAVVGQYITLEGQLASGSPDHLNVIADSVLGQ
ncbi:MAG: acyl-CoA dehydrogenase family protein [Acidovorax sp.]|uniref:acyl-CoA dehydrogenase family protein n=1 Tax=Acidovorax sp. TaxID=1872122 RepID=UPI00391C0A76